MYTFYSESYQFRIDYHTTNHFIQTKKSTATIRLSELCAFLFHSLCVATMRRFYFLLANLIIILFR